MQVVREQPQGGLFMLPGKFYQNNPDQENALSAGDREALSTMIAAFTFSPRIYDLMRFVTALNSTIQAYLVKKNKYTEYTVIFQDISRHITTARILLDNPRDHGRAASLLYSLETALKVIAEREGLTQTGAAMYDGKMPITPFAGDSSEGQEADPYGV